MGESPWYVDLFRRDYYRGFAPRFDPERTAREVDFVVQALALEPGASILDLCCGHGRHAIPLAQRGYGVTGLDLSAYHLRLAREAAREAGVNVRWLRRDMRDIRTAGAYDAVINMFSAFGLLESDDDDFAVLEAVERALKRGGQFMIQTRNREWVVRYFQESDWRELEGGLITMERRRFDLLTGRIESEWSMVPPGGRRRRHRISFRAYTLAEFTKMLGRAGLSVARTWGDFDGSDYGLESPWMIVLAEKTAAS
jgi:SAM-dependent methyltransferase